MDSQLRTQPTKQPPQSFAKGNSIVRSRFGGVPSTVEEVFFTKYGSVACLVERPTRETRTEQYSDTILNDQKRASKSLSLFSCQKNVALAQFCSYAAAISITISTLCENLQAWPCWQVQGDQCYSLGPAMTYKLGLSPYEERAQLSETRLIRLTF